MNWTTFQTHNDDPRDCFEVLCNQLFENWVKKEYEDTIKTLSFVNGSGGDGGVESYATLKDGSIIGLQAKWFPSSIQSSQIDQIRGSVNTAMSVRPAINKYIVCIPRDLASTTNKGVNSESARWNKFVKEIAIKYPKLELELWNETRILCELQKEVSVGIYKFWFEKSEITKEALMLSFEKSKTSWLDTRYVPELNTFGLIDDCISKYLGTDENQSKLIQVSDQILDLSKKALERIHSIKCIGYPYKQRFAEAIDGVETVLHKLISTYREVNTWAINECCLSFTYDPEELQYSFRNYLGIITESDDYHSQYFKIEPLVKILEELDSQDISFLNKYLNYAMERRPLIFLGEPGTGKTHGIAATVEKLCRECYHIPILLQAKDIPGEWGWAEIIRNILGLSNSWSESEIWQGLDSRASRNKRQKLTEGKIVNYEPKIFVVVDGIDESSTQSKWIERIKQTSAISQLYTNVKFCFLSRPYVFEDKKISARIEKLRSSGDVPVRDLFDKYIDHYHIDIQNLVWIKDAIKTPFALKIFCDINAGKVITYKSRADISIASLLREKIKKLEYEFCVQDADATAEDQYVFKAINMLSFVFNSNPRIERDTLIAEISDHLSISNNRARKLVSYLCQYGLLRVHVAESSDLLLPSTYYYYPGIQGYFDYAGALLLLRKYKLPERIQFGDFSGINRNTLYMLAVISIQDFRYLITNNSSLAHIIDQYSIQELYYFSLKQTSYENALPFRKDLEAALYQSADNVRKITNNVILPLAREPRHPLGVLMLDNFLKAFNSPAERDLYWSIPANLRYWGDEIWQSEEDIALDDSEFSLKKTDTFEGLPCIYAWGLTTVDNNKRQFYRTSLMKWSLEAPFEFFKLFQHFAVINDPQLKNDIFSIMMSLVFECNNKELLKEVAEWIMDNTLSPQNISFNRDIAIRYYSISILKKAIEFQMVDESEAQKYLPPYTNTKNVISLNEEALSGSRMGGYSGITYDLARYVLIDHITSCFETYSSEDEHRLAAFVEMVATQNPIACNISFDQFVLSAAFSFLREQGWNEEKHMFFRKGSPEKMGVDIAIVNSYPSQTHGSQSEVMNLAEKYTWQARKYILGFCADYIKVVDEETGKENYITDYGMFDKFLIPVLEIKQEAKFYEKKYHWHFPEHTSVLIEGCTTSQEQIKQLVETAPDINWQKWLHKKNRHDYPLSEEDLIVLYGYTGIQSPTDIETNLFINTILVPSDKRNSFIEKISVLHDGPLRSGNPYEWFGGVSCDCYISPKEICWMPWKEKCNCSLVDYYSEYQILSAVDSCTYNFDDSGDKSYYVPSELIRKYLNICNTNGEEFYNDLGEIVVLKTSIGVAWENHQKELLVGKSVLNLLEKEGYSLVWILRELRRENTKAREKYGRFRANKDKSFTAYYTNGDFIVKPITIIASERKEVDHDMEDLFSLYSTTDPEIPELQEDEIFEKE